MSCVRFVLGCQGVNLIGAIQPNQQEVRTVLNALSAILDVAYVAVDSAAQLVKTDATGAAAAFSCTNDPLTDYYAIVKPLDTLAQAEKVSDLIHDMSSLSDYLAF